MTPRLGLSLLMLFVVSIPMAGCKDSFGPPPLPVPTMPPQDSPRNLMIRFREVYQRQRIAEHNELFTTDFRFRFSAATDPELATRYGDNWGRVQELSYADHLFHGFRDSLGTFQPGASRIMMNLDPFPIDDPVRTDSSAHYKTLVVPRLSLEVDVPTSPEATSYRVDGRYQFWIVRGDAAALDSTQASDSLRWYMYRWEDQSTPSASVATTVASSWGRLKAAYR